MIYAVPFAFPMAGVGRENPLRKTLDDLIAFNRYHFENSPTLRRVKARITWLVPAILLVATVLYLFQGEYELLILPLGCAILWALLTPAVFRWSIDRSARRLYGEGSNKGMVGPHELELTADSLEESTPYGQQRAALKSIERVASSDKYSFIYLNAVMAHVVPHDAVQEGDAKAFIDAVK